MYSVQFTQLPYGQQKPKSFSETYTTYAEVIDSILDYFGKRMGIYPNEMLLHYTYYYTQHTLSEIPDLLREKEEYLQMGYSCDLHLKLDATDYPDLQTVKIQMPERVAALEAERAARLERNGGRLCYCGCPDCDWDCGVLACGCIDLCRGRCGCGSRFDRDEW